MHYKKLLMSSVLGVQTTSLKDHTPIKAELRKGVRAYETQSALD